tara:strand:+ start:600 stop:857 length:258 start_codon:yes stop_codon:yes gene_type:complete
MFGGGIAQFVEKSIINDQKIGKAFGASFILLIVLFFFMKVFIVKWTYNKIMPRLIVNNGNSIRNFTPLTNMEAFILVLFFQFIMH